MGQDEYGGQSQSDNVFVFRVTVKELMITGSSVLLFLFQLENKKLILPPWVL